MPDTPNVADQASLVASPQDDDLADSSPAESSADDDSNIDHVDEQPQSNEPIDDDDSEVESASLQSLLTEAGIGDFDSSDDMEKIQGLIQSHRQGQQLQQQVTELQQQAQMAQQQAQQQAYQQYYAQQAQQAHQAQGNGQPPQKMPATGLLQHWNEVPEYQDDWLDLVEADEKGNLVSRNGAQPDLPQKISTRNKWERQALRTFLENPRDFISEVVANNPQIAQAVDQRVAGALGQSQQQSTIDNIIRDSESWLVSRDESGQASWTPEGILYQQNIAELDQQGIRDPQYAHELAKRFTEREIGRSLDAPPAATETNVEKKKRLQLDFAKKAASKSTSRGNAIPGRNGDPRPPELVQDFQAMLAADFQQSRAAGEL